MTRKTYKPRPKGSLLYVLGRVRDAFPLTVLGVLLAVAGYLAYFVYGTDKVDFIVMGIGIVLLALVGLSLVAVLLSWPLVHALLGKSSGLPESLTVGVPSETGFRPIRLPWLPFVQIGFVWEDPAEVELEVRKVDGRWVEVVTPLERGRFTHVTRRFTLRDIFGFAELRFSHRWQTPLRIQPVPGRADLTLAIRRATEDGYSHPSGQPLGELVDMRRYAPGDPVRHILWKVFARSRRLMVREPERAIAPKPAMVGFFVAGPADEPSASTARLFLEKGMLGSDFVFAAEGANHPTSNVAEAVEQVIESRSFRGSGADGLAPLLRSVDRGRLDNLVVFAPGRDGAWVEKLISAARRLPMPPMVVMTVDGPIDQARRSRLARALFRTEDDGDESVRALRDLPKVYDRLRAAGMELKVLHRGAGAKLGQVSVDAMRAVT